MRNAEPDTARAFRKRLLASIWIGGIQVRHGENNLIDLKGNFIDSTKRKNNKNKPTFVDLFAGCGGLSLGLLQAGWNGLLAIEKDEQAFETLEFNLIKNNGHVRLDWPEEIPARRFRLANFMSKYRDYLNRKFKGKVDLMTGGPPCQGFSYLGRRHKNDSRNNLFEQYAAFVELLRPKLLLIENVKGIGTVFGKKRDQLLKKSKRGRKKKTYVEKIREKLGRIGYELHLEPVISSEFGVPQRRPRIIIIGVDRSLFQGDAHLAYNFLIKIFVSLEKFKKDFLSSKGLPTNHPISVKDAISDLECERKALIECFDSKGFKQIEYKGPETSYQKFLNQGTKGKSLNSLRLANHRDATLKRNMNILKDTKAGKCRKGVTLNSVEKGEYGINKHCFTVLDENKPSHTLSTLPDDFLHYSEPRILTVRECARIQSFPDWFDFKGKYTTGGKSRTRECPRYTQVGNAVPPLLAEAIGLILLKALSILENPVSTSKL